MRRLPVQNNSSGFTLIEMLAIVSIIGILAAISAPSFMAVNQRSQVNEAMNQVRGALQEAQREAMRRSRTCNVRFTVANRQITSVDNCLVTGPRNLRNNTSLRTSLTTFQYDFRGLTFETPPDPLVPAVRLDELSPPIREVTIVVAHPDNPREQRCVVFSTPLGLIRSGTYERTDTIGTFANNCRSS